MKDFDISLNKKCRCTQKECPVLGNCVLCVQNHVEKGNHLPECMQNLIRTNIKSLAEIVEYGCTEKRPAEGFWETYDKETLVQNSLKRHKG